MFKFSRLQSLIPHQANSPYVSSDCISPHYVIPHNNTTNNYFIQQMSRFLKIPYDNILGKVVGFWIRTKLLEYVVTNLYFLNIPYKIGINISQ